MAPRDFSDPSQSSHVASLIGFVVVVVIDTGSIAIGTALGGGGRGICQNSCKLVFCCGVVVVSIAAVGSS